MGVMGRRYGIERAEIKQHGEVTDWEYVAEHSAYRAWVRVFFKEVKRDGGAETGPFEYSETAAVAAADVEESWRGSRTDRETLRKHEIELTIAKMACRLGDLRASARGRGLDLVVVPRPRAAADRDIPPGPGGRSGE